MFKNMLATQRNGVCRLKKNNLPKILITSCDNYIVITARTKVRIGNFNGILTLVLSKNWKLTITQSIQRT